MKDKITSSQLKAIEDLQFSIYAPMFAERGDLREAFAFAHELAKASDNPSAVYTAVHVVANTIASRMLSKIRMTLNPTSVLTLPRSNHVCATARNHVAASVIVVPLSTNSAGSPRSPPGASGKIGRAHV